MKAFLKAILSTIILLFFAVIVVILVRVLVYNYFWIATVLVFAIPITTFTFYFKKID